MEWNYNEENLTELYQKWATFGWMVSEPRFNGYVDLEQLITETTRAARYDGRLMKWLMTWFKEFGDLVNKKNLLRYIKQADSAVLGAVLEIAMKHGADKNYKIVIDKCIPNSPMEVFDKAMMGISIYAEEQIQHGKDDFRKWGFYCTMIEFYTDSIRSREWIFKNNRLLAIRAIFGVNIRAEILNSLDQNGSLAIRKLSIITGYAYSGVYREVENLLANGFVREHTGNGRIFQLSESMLNIIKVAA